MRVSPDAERTATPQPPESPGLAIERSGFAVLGRRLGFAALISNTGEKTLGDITLRVILRDPEGDVIDSFRDGLPFCPPQQDCWWGTAFGGRDFGPEWRSTADVDVSVVDAGGPYRGTGTGPSVVPFGVERAGSGVIRGHVPADEGVAFVLAFSGPEPRSGIALNVSKDMGFGLDLKVPASLLPPLRGREQLRAFMYPAPVRAGS
ncbi:MAG: hypothetical protein M3360_07320 [Actinomycetota bacterium]|nr:hypothetical protein [Actinomycetota bacterium]